MSADTTIVVADVQVPSGPYCQNCRFGTGGMGAAYCMLFQQPRRVVTYDIATGTMVHVFRCEDCSSQGVIPEGCTIMIGSLGG